MCTVANAIIVSLRAVLGAVFALLGAVLALLGAVLAQPALADGAPPASDPLPYGIEVVVLASSCSGCHARPNSGLPRLAGRRARGLTRKLLGYRDGSRAGTVMPRIAAGYTPAQLRGLANYFADQKPRRRRTSQ